MDSCPKLRAWQFTYLKGDTNHAFETMPFYLNTLRKFLRNNLGKIVWLKGGIIEKPAYLLFYSELSEQVFKILVKPLKDGGRFGVIPVQNPIELARKYLREERIAVGYLDLTGGSYIGNPESVRTPEEVKLIEKVRAGIILKDGYTMIRAEDAEQKIVERKTPFGTIEKAPMLILTNAVELLVENGKIIGVDPTVKPKMGIWVDLMTAS